MSFAFAAIILVPLVVAAAAAFILNQGVRGAIAVAFGGLVLALAFVLFAYLSGPTDHPPFGCSDCGRYGGRWWDPAAVFVVVIFGLSGWLVGTGAGAIGRRLTRR